MAIETINIAQKLVIVKFLNKKIIMKKFLISSIFAVALIATTVWGVNKSMNSDANLSDLALANVEALAQNENPGTDWDCAPSTKIVCYWENTKKVFGKFYWI